LLLSFTLLTFFIPPSGDAHILKLRDTIENTGVDAKITFTYKIGSLIGFAAKLTKELLKEELSHPEVKYIEADQIVSINYQQENNTISHSKSSLAVVTQTGAMWGLVRISQRVRDSTDTNYLYNSAGGNGVDVYVLDTGIFTTHVDFGGRAYSVYNAITNESPTDLNGHGTHCAGVIGGIKYGVAKNVTLFSAKVLSGSGSGSISGVVAGVDYVTLNQRTSRKSVACVSFGGGISTTLDEAITKSINSGIVYTVTAGNQNDNACNYSPGRVPTAVTVGATSNTDTRNSNYGPCISLFAPGQLITSDWIGSITATNTISGPSQTFAAGALAIRLSVVPSLTPSQSKAWLISVATPNVVVNPGSNSSNLLLYSPYN